MTASELHTIIVCHKSNITKVFLCDASESKRESESNRKEDFTHKNKLLCVDKCVPNGHKQTGVK